MTTRSFTLLLAIGWGLSALTLVSCLANADTDTTTATNASNAKQAATQEVKSLVDPSILLRRTWLETEWNTFRDGSDTVEETLGALWAWRVTESMDWGVRLKLPYLWRMAGDAPGDADGNGFGDMGVATGPAFRLGEFWRVGAGVDLRMPTAQEGLGADVWRLQEFGVIACDVTRWLLVNPSFEHNHSVDEESGAAAQHFLEMFLPATLLLPENWFLTARYEAKVDFEDDDRWTHSGSIGVGKGFERTPINFLLAAKRPFDTGNKEFQVNFVATYFFR